MLATGAWTALGLASPGPADSVRPGCESRAGGAGARGRRPHGTRWRCHPEADNGSPGTPPGRFIRPGRQQPWRPSQRLDDLARGWWKAANDCLPAQMPRTANHRRAARDALPRLDRPDERHPHPPRRRNPRPANQQLTGPPQPHPVHRPAPPAGAARPPIQPADRPAAAPGWLAGSVGSSIAAGHLMAARAAHPGSSEPHGGPPDSGRAAAWTRGGPAAWPTDSPVTAPGHGTKADGGHSQSGERGR